MNGSDVLNDLGESHFTYFFYSYLLWITDWRGSVRISHKCEITLQLWILYVVLTVCYICIMIAYDCVTVAWESHFTFCFYSNPPFRISCSECTNLAQRRNAETATSAWLQHVYSQAAAMRSGSAACVGGVRTTVGLLGCLDEAGRHVRDCQHDKVVVDRLTA